MIKFVLLTKRFTHLLFFDKKQLSTLLFVWARPIYFYLYNLNIHSKFLYKLTLISINSISCSIKLLIYFKQNFSMNLIEIDRLSRQTQHKSQTISRLQNQIQCLKNDIRTQKQISARSESQKNQLRKQIETLKRKNQEQDYQKEHTESRFVLVLKKLQDQIQQWKRKFNKLNNKISPLIDHDSVRLAVMAELSQHYDIQTDRLKHTIEVQKDQINKLKRQNTLLQHKIETLKIDYEQRIRMLNNSVKSESSQNQLTAISLEMGKEIQNRLKASYETVRKQAEYYKDKYFTTEKRYQDKVISLERQLKDLKLNAF